MTAVKILHCGDLHIGSSEAFLGEKAVARRMEGLLTFERIVDIALERGVGIVLICGDLFDSNRVEPLFFNRVMEKVSAAKSITFVYSAGNHDPLNASSPFSNAALPDNFRVMPTVDSYTDIGEDVRIYGRSFSEILDKGEERFSLIPDDGKINIMCIHGEYGFGGEQNPITNFFVEQSGMDYIALGHVHTRTLPKKIGKTYIAYCGCPEGLGFDELDEKGVYIGEIGKNSCELEFVPTCRRMHLAPKIDVTGLADNASVFEKALSVLKEKYGESFGENLYKIILSGEVDEGCGINAAELSGRFNRLTYFAKVIDKTTLKFDLEGLQNEMSLKGVFVRKMLERAQNTPEDSDRIQTALRIGLRAFSGEVELLEDQ